MPPARFDPTIPVSERPNTHALDRAATGIGSNASLCTTPLALTDYFAPLTISARFEARFYKLRPMLLTLGNAVGH